MVASQCHSLDMSLVTSLPHPHPDPPPCSIQLASWMERKLEAMKLDAAIAERVQADEAERKLAQEAQEREERRRQKAQVKEYCREKGKKQAVALEREKERLLLLQQEQAEQAKRDKERYTESTGPVSCCTEGKVFVTPSLTTSHWHLGFYSAKSSD